MSRKNLPYAGTTTETVEMTEIDGMEQGAILRYMDLGKPNEPCSVREIKTTMGDLYVIVNALRDYANLLESAVSSWELSGYHKAAYEIHAERCRKISRKYADAMGYDYDKALEHCRRRRARDGDTGKDGLEALVRRCGDKQN